jgi:DNA-binding MarR family transcriptional regulator
VTPAPGTTPGDDGRSEERASGHERASARPGPSGTTFDRLVHEPARLLLLACLYVVDRADFVFLLRQTGLTAGNVSSHVSKLEEAGYVDVQKGFSGKRPQTILRLTKRGRDAVRSYRDAMTDLLDSLAD